MNAQLATSTPGGAAEADRLYIALRIIDTFLREDIRGLASQGRIAEPPAHAQAAWRGAKPPLWWQVDHLPGGRRWLAVEPRDHMQAIGAVSDHWLREVDGLIREEAGIALWLEQLCAGLDDATVALHRAYADEAACAAMHRALAHEAFAAQRARLADALTHPDAHERALRLDQLASYRDHPFYPTARAKSGFGEGELRRYAPEFAPYFALHWLAVSRASLTCTTPAPPKFWPSMHDVGLASSLAATHALLPVHPLTWPRLAEFPFPDDIHRAPRTALLVRPTLSVRTVVPVDHPDTHLKLPLLMRTLGALNLRLIKPSTLYDGHWFERVLRAIGEQDRHLQGRYVHVDESHGGHVDDSRHLAYLVRRYPELGDATLLPVAALCATMPDGRALALHLADRFHGGDLFAWWRAYAALLCSVHLRLWLVHGIALESNQQNAMLMYRPGSAPSLLMKDNDAARVLLPRLASSLGTLDAFGPLRDARIAVDDDDALARMFCTITLQLCLTAVLEGLAVDHPATKTAMYAILRSTLNETLATLADQGVDIAPARALLDAPRLPVKYLLSAGSLLGKEVTGAADINKFYGDSGPNFMRAAEAG